MSTEQTAALDLRYVEEVLNRGNLEAIDELCAPDYVSHVPGNPPMNREGDKQLVGMLRAAFPDFHCTVEDHIVEGNNAVHRLVCRGTHQGELMGIPPTGRMAAVTGININRCAAGKLAESWGVMDMLGMLQQLGAIPAPGETEG